MKNKWTYHVLLAVIFLVATAFIHNTEKQATIPFKGKFFTTDNLGNLFLIGKDNSIEKYTADGKLQTVANFKIYGNLSQLDVTNPFEIYAFYYDQQTLLILDNMLSLRAEISLSDVSNSEISAAARSFDNGIWYFDASSMKLFKTNKSLETKVESVPMATWTKQDWYPHQILDNDKNIFVNDSTNGISIFDVFGNYYKTLDIMGLNDFQVKKNKVFFFKDQYLQSYDFKLFRTDTLAFDSLARHIRIENNTLYSWRNDSLYIEKK